MSEYRETVRRKAQDLRIRNNEIENLVSRLSVSGDGEGLDQFNHTAEFHKVWEEAMTKLGMQFHAIQELIGTTK